MKKYDRSKVVENYYRASGALMEIGTTENIPDELRQLALNASSTTMKIIDYINEHREQTIIEKAGVKEQHCICCGNEITANNLKVCNKCANEYEF